jgi:2-polyprenyl-3-methyl-5-hydroxy-6-metoxy-1,4-benzoquinol methylase
MLITKDELDKIANSYHENDSISDKFIEDECQFYSYSWIFKNLAENSSVLELGFGEGNFTKELVLRGFNTTVIEGSRILLDKAEKLYGEKITLVHALFEEYTPTCKFDFILATHVLEHVNEPVKLLKKMSGWLSPQGKIIIIVPNKESLHRQIAVLMGLIPSLDTLSERDNLVGHQRVYSLDTLENDVKAAGLSVVDKTGFFLKTLPNSMMLDFKPQMIKALNDISPNLSEKLLANIGLVVQL